MYNFPAASCPPPETGGRDSTVPEGPQKSALTGSVGPVISAVSAVSAAGAATAKGVIVLFFPDAENAICGSSGTAEAAVNPGALCTCVR